MLKYRDNQFGFYVVAAKQTKGYNPKGEDIMSCNTISKQKQVSAERALKYCEAKEDHLHKELALILNNLANNFGVDRNLISEIEDLYIQKGILYCESAYEIGYNEGSNVSSMLTG